MNGRQKLGGGKGAANVRDWVTAVVVVERSTTTEVSATFINMLARSDQTADLDLDQDGAELFASSESSFMTGSELFTDGGLAQI